MVDLPAPIPKNAIVTKRFAPKFCAEWSDREVHSSHEDHFHDHFYVYVSAPKNWPRSLKPHCHKVVRTEILCRMVQSRAPQLSWGLFSWPFPCLCLGASFQQPSNNLWTAFGQPLGNFGATKMADKKRVKKTRPWIFFSFLLTFWEFRFLPYDFLSTDIRCTLTDWQRKNWHK